SFCGQLSTDYWLLTTDYQLTRPPALDEDVEHSDEAVGSDQPHGIGAGLVDSQGERAEAARKRANPAAADDGAGRPSQDLQEECAVVIARPVPCHIHRLGVDLEDLIDEREMRHDRGEE